MNRQKIVLTCIWVVIAGVAVFAAMTPSRFLLRFDQARPVVAAIPAIGFTRFYEGVTALRFESAGNRCSIVADTASGPRELVSAGKASTCSAMALGVTHASAALSSDGKAPVVIYEAPWRELTR